MVTAKALVNGEVLLSGPTSGISLKRWMNDLKMYNIDLMVIDGALSRLSSASPAISESMILATGAALSNNIKTLVQKTDFVVNLINIDIVENKVIEFFDDIESGIWGLTDQGELIDTKTKTSLVSSGISTDVMERSRYIFVAGALTDRFLNSFRQDKRVHDVVLVVRDFTKIFVTPLAYSAFLKAGGCLRVIHRSKLIAITVNPTAPSGFAYDSGILCSELSEKIGLPVYDILKYN